MSARRDSSKLAGESSCGPHRLTGAYSSTQTTFPLAWLQNWILPVHLSRRWTPIDDEMTCHRKRMAIEAAIISTAIMTVIGERFMGPSLRRVTGTWRYTSLALERSIAGAERVACESGSCSLYGPADRRKRMGADLSPASRTVRPWGNDGARPPAGSRV
jgi:hypothetical protein